MNKYPFVKQSCAKDCGACCLLMVLKYYQGNYPFEALLDLTKTSKMGTSAYHLVTAASQLGFVSKGIAFDQLDLVHADLVYPLIAHVTIDCKYQHFIVIYQYDSKRKRFFIADPATERTWIKEEQFYQIWNKVVIVLEPVKLVSFTTPKISLLSFFKDSFLQYKSDFVWMFVLSMIVMICSIIGSFSFQIFFQSFQQVNPVSTLLCCILLFFLFGFFKLWANVIRHKLFLFFSRKIDQRLTNTTLFQLFSLPYAYYKNRTTGDVVARIQDVNKISILFQQVFFLLFVDLPLSIGAFLVLYFLNPLLCGISFIFCILYFLLFLSFRKRKDRYIQMEQQIKAELSSQIVESLSNFEGMKGHALENVFFHQFKKIYQKGLDQSLEFSFLQLKQNYLRDGLQTFGTLFLLGVGCFLVLKGNMQLGSLLTFQALLTYLMDPLYELSQFDQTYFEAKNALLRIHELFYQEKESGIYKTFVPGNITFHQLCYSYNDFDDVICNFNFSCCMGSKVAFIGKSGCGKSTIFKLLMKYYPIKRGMIQIGDYDLCDYQQKALENHVIYLSSFETLFTDSLYHNLTCYESIPDKQLQEIVQLCCVDEIIDKNPLGYQMLLEENGFNLSGGQRQRILLARTLLRPFDILLIDEAFNQINPELERVILSSLFSYFKHKTIFIITHRMENLDLFDQVVSVGEEDRCAS